MAAPELRQRLSPAGPLLPQVITEAESSIQAASDWRLGSPIEANPPAGLGGGIYVGGGEFAACDGSDVYGSKNGSNWVNLSNIVVSNGDMNTSAYNGPNKLATGRADSGSATLIYSIDNGFTWNLVSIPVGVGFINDAFCLFDGTKFIIIGQQTRDVISSIALDNADWDVSPFEPNSQPLGLALGPNGLIATAQAPNKYAVTGDIGNTAWNHITLPGNPTTLYNIDYDPSTNSWVICGQEDSNIPTVWVMNANDNSFRYKFQRTFIGSNAFNEIKVMPGGGTGVVRVFDSMYAIDISVEAIELGSMLGLAVDTDNFGVIARSENGLIVRTKDSGFAYSGSVIF